MKSLKNHLSLIIPLFAIFFSIEFYMITDKIIKKYEVNLKEDYTIILVAKKELKEKDLEGYVDIAKLEEIDPKYMINRLKNENIDIDVNALKRFLPKFYKLYLNHFPSSYELNKIKKRLINLDSIQRIETFSKTHTKIFNLLLVLKQISKIFLLLIGIISFLLILKQIHVWHLEHRERMYIMELFGAPLWMRSGLLIRLAIVDTFISTLALIGAYYYILNSKIVKEFFEFININISLEKIIQDCFILGAAGLIITLFSVIYVSTRQFKE